MTRILDRLVHHCNFVSMTGDSYRMREREGLVITPPRKRGRPARPAPASDTGDDEYTDETDEGDDA